MNCKNKQADIWRPELGKDDFSLKFGSRIGYLSWAFRVKEVSSYWAGKQKESRYKIADHSEQSIFLDRIYVSGAVELQGYFIGDQNISVEWIIVENLNIGVWSLFSK